MEQTPPRDEIWEIRGRKRCVQIWPESLPWQDRPREAQFIGGVGWVLVIPDPCDKPIENSTD